MSACPMQKVGAITQPMEPLSQNSSSPATVLGSSPVVPTTTLMPKASACLVASWQASGVEKSTSTPLRSPWATEARTMSRSSKMGTSFASMPATSPESSPTCLTSMAPASSRPLALVMAATAALPILPAAPLTITGIALPAALPPADARVTNRSPRGDPRPPRGEERIQVVDAECRPPAPAGASTARAAPCRPTAAREEGMLEPIWCAGGSARGSGVDRHLSFPLPYSAPPRDTWRA
mmetsp:Transcript_10410/g.33639  ORF Transcript_10410/g.33639 Transcript_10410/m.33639 type:complete len:237 (-) Transcript_10410:12-722(-)